MKKTLTVLVVLALLGVGLHAQSTNLAPVALSAPASVPRPNFPIKPVKLDAAHSVAFLSAIAGVVTLPAGTQPVSGSYYVNADGTVTISGSVRPTGPVTSQ